MPQQTKSRSNNMAAAVTSANDTMERTASCCLGDMFFRKRRLTGDMYAPAAKPKIPLDGVATTATAETASGTSSSSDAAAQKVRLFPDENATPPSPTESSRPSYDRPPVLRASNNQELNTKYQGSIDDYSRTTTVSVVPGQPTVRSAVRRPSPSAARVDAIRDAAPTASDSYSRAVRQPLTPAVDGRSVDDEPPPEYSSKDQLGSTPPPTGPSSGRRRVPAPRSAVQPPIVSNSLRQAKEQETVQSLWMEAQQQPVPATRPALLHVNGMRTVHILDRNTGTTYRRGRLLGKGGFARCYEMTDTNTNLVYAGKVISKARISKPRQREKIMREIELHRALRHNNIVHFHSFFEDDQNVYFILEHCSRKSLADILKTRQLLTEPEVRFYMTQLIIGCQYIHGCHVVHRDLKLGNMLVNENMQVKIADFGLATRIEYRGEKKMTVCGTPNYIAPEVIQRKGHSYEADIWSIGCIMYTLLCGRPPFETSSLKETYERIATNHFTVPNHVSPAARDLICVLLSHNPHDRPSLGAILRHEFFTSGYLPPMLNTNCCFSAPKFPAFEPPKSKPVAAPVPAAKEVVTADQQFRRLGSQRPLPPVKKLESPVVVKADMNTPKTDFATEKAKLAEKFQRSENGVGRLCSAIRLYKTLSSCLDVMPPDSLPTPVPNSNQMWVTKWVDYSNKYGFGYQLSDGSVGILYNDTTRMVMLTDGRTMQYNDLSNKVVSLTKDDVPNDLQKKVTLLVYFNQYMDEHLIYGADLEAGKQSASGVVPEPVMASGVFMKKWFRTDRAIVMHLSNGTLQVNFFDDHTKVIIGVDGQDYLVTYIDASRHSVSYRLLQLRHFGCSAQIADRLRYARHVLQTVINIAGEAV